MLYPSDEQRLLNTVASLDPATAQNRLTGVRDRDLAIAISRLTEQEQNSLLQRIPPPKAQRVREELAREPHLRITLHTYRQLLGGVISRLQGATAGGPGRSYLRPTGPCSRY